jgi:hypothetical protein
MGIITADWVIAEPGDTPLRNAAVRIDGNHITHVGSAADLLRQFPNDEVTDELLQKLQDAGVAAIETIYTNDLDQGAYISQTLRADDTPDQTAARVAIYRMMR